MVRKTYRKPRKGAAAAGSDDISRRIITAALELSAAEGWRSLSLAGIADEAGVGLAELHQAFASKTAILAGFLKTIDAKVLAGGKGDADEDPRDRLFEVLMRRFDALNPHKAAISGILRETLFDPAAASVLAPRFIHSMAWMLEAAGLSSAELGGRLRVNGLALLYMYALRVWLGDDSQDMAKTMAALDKGLRRAEWLAARLRCPGAARGKQASAAGDA